MKRITHVAEMEDRDRCRIISPWMATPTSFTGTLRLDAALLSKRTLDDNRPMGATNKQQASVISDTRPNPFPWSAFGVALAALGVCWLTVIGGYTVLGWLWEAVT